MLNKTMTTDSAVMNRRDMTLPPDGSGQFSGELGRSRASRVKPSHHANPPSPATSLVSGPVIRPPRQPGKVQRYARGTVGGREAIRALYEQLLAQVRDFKPEEPLPTLRIGDLALTSTRASDEAGARAQVVRRQPDGTWLRILDRPDFRG